MKLPVYMLIFMQIGFDKEEMEMLIGDIKEEYEKKIVELKEQNRIGLENGK